ncbi:MAG: RNA polymerase-binding protein DksA [Nitrospirota bacterium]
MAKIKTVKTTKKAKPGSLNPSSKSGKISSLKKKSENKTASASLKHKGETSRSGKTAIKTNKKNYSSSRDKKIQEIRTNLLSQKESLLSEAVVALNELPGQTVFPDLGDQASAETDRNFMLRLRGREQRLLKKIEEAIDRIENGTFGICEDCGEEIDIKRLEARPVTTMCIDCKTLQEEEEKLREA